MFEFRLLFSFFLILILILVSISNYAFSIETNLPLVIDKNLTVQIVYQGLRFPANMAFLGSDDILVLEKNEGTVQRIVNGVMLAEPLLDVDVSPIGERGMLGIAIGNNKSEDISHVFLYYTKPERSKHDDKSPVSNSIYKYELKNNKLVNPKILVHLPTLHQFQHNGGILLIGPDDDLYSMIGEGDASLQGSKTKAKTQNSKDGFEADGRGGVLTMTQDGEIAHKHGILGDSSPLNLYYAYGIRNSFGMDFDPVSGKLWDTENGANNGDEINLVAPGFNSGSNKVQGLSSMQEGFSKSQLETFDGKGNYSEPEFTWNRTVGVTALKFLNSDKLGKQYENDMFVGDFHNGYLYRFDLNNKRTALVLTGHLKDKIASEKDNFQDILFGKGFGGITDIKVGPDGYLYVLSLQQGGDQCLHNQKSIACLRYDSEVSGTIFKIVPKQDLP